MKKLMFVAVAAVSAVAFADGESTHADLKAETSGFYDVQLTAKYLAHSTKTATFTTTKKTPEDIRAEYAVFVSNPNQLANFVIDEGTYKETTKTSKGEPVLTKISVKYSYSDYNLFDKRIADVPENRSYKTKLVSKTNKGVYDANTGKVYMWDTASDAKVSVTNGGMNAIVLPKEKKGVQQLQKGYCAYEVPLAMHDQFIGTDDAKAAGGFKGGSATAKDGTDLDFSGVTAYGSGTLDKEGVVKSVSGNMAGKHDDQRFGCYGTWSIKKDTSTKTKLAGKDINAVLRGKSCVELVLENNDPE